MFFYCLLQEVIRIRAEHPDDNQAVFNDRVKGQLKVTRAFGAGFLKRVSCSCKFDVFKKLFLSCRTFLGSLFLRTFQHKFSYMMDAPSEGIGARIWPRSSPCTRVRPLLAARWLFHRGDVQKCVSPALARGRVLSARHQTSA